MPQSTPSDNAAVVVFNVALGWCAWVFSYTGMPMEPSSILGALMLLDCATGVAKAHILGHPVYPWRIERGILAKLSLLAVPLTVALAAKAAGGELLWLVNYTVTVMVLSEAYSILANIQMIRTGKDVPELDAVTLILERIRGVLEKLNPRQ